MTAITTLQIAAITAAITLVIAAIAGYMYALRPAERRARQQRDRANLLEIQLDDERRLRADLLRWIAIESRDHHAPAVHAAVQRRAAERIKQLEQVQQRARRLQR